jgi:putative flippase GtrA
MNGAQMTRLVRFGLVGVAGAAIHMAAFAGIGALTGASHATSWAASFVIAATTGWAMNRRFTFRAAPEEANGGEWLRYLLIAGLGAAAHFAVFNTAVSWIAFFDRHPAFAIVPGSLASLCVTYIGAALFVFGSARKRP